MALSKSEILTARFYEWEQRGRGTTLFPLAVRPEPEYHPFYGHYTYNPAIIDDSRHHTLVSGVIEFLKFKPKPVPEDNSHLVDIPPVTALPYEIDANIAVFSIVLPKDEKLEVRDVEQLLLMLSYTEQQISFEIIATDTTISMQFACREVDQAHVYAMITAYFPAAVVSRNDEKGREVLESDFYTCVINFALREEFMRPICMADEVEQDPYIGLFATLEHLQKGERGVIQVIFKGAMNPWAESIMRSVTDNRGDCFFADAPDMVKLAQAKVSAPLYAVCVRVAGQTQAAVGTRAMDIARSIGTALTRVTGSKSNSLQMVGHESYPLDDIIADTYLRQSQFAGMLLNGRELATLVHFPTPEIASNKIERDAKKTKAVPESAQGHRFILGKNIHHGQENIVSVPTSLRLRHTHIIGATGTGKSTMLLSMIAQDMRQGNGVAVLDPHGDLIESILAYVPQERIRDVILIDPADGEYPVGFNILNAHSEIEKDILSSDLVAAFKRLSTSWGDQMNSVFANAILAFLESTEGGTLMDLRRFLVEKPFREAYLKTVADPHVVYYWTQEYPLLKSNSIGSILTRLDTFLRPNLIRNMVAQKKGLDFENILDTKKILLIKLSQGLIGAENSFLLGTFFVSKMYQAAMARQARSKADRSDYFLYIDEFQHFSTPSMSHILSGARKYHLGLILAHQDMQQVAKYDTELANSVVVNAGTRICFRLGDVDAKRFAGGFSFFDAADLENLHIGEAIARIEQPNFDFNLTTIPLPELKADVAEATMQAVIAQSRQRYGTPKEEVEQSLAHVGRTQKEEVQEPKPQESVQEKTPPPQTEPFVPVEIPTKAAPVQKTETQHRYLQTLVKRTAELRGYKAVIEELTPDGKGRVDVSLERGGRRIAVEVSVTTGDEWEARNVEKCLAAGYETVIVCSNDAKHLRRIKKQLESKLAKEQLARVFTLSSEEVTNYLDREIVMEERSQEKVVRGYRVKVKYNAATPEEMKLKEGHFVKAVVDSMRKETGK